MHCNNAVSRHTANTVQCSAVQCSAVQCSAVQCSAVQYSTIIGASFVRVERDVYHKTNTSVKSLLQISRAPTLELKAQRGREFSKPFLYLTQTKRCLAPMKASSHQIGDPETCNCDVIVLSYEKQCQKESTATHISYMFGPNTTWTSGRNELFFAAMKRQLGYHYYIFIDEDTVPTFNKHTPPEMQNLRPFRAFEEWLLDYEPALGVVNYWRLSARQAFRKRQSLCGITEESMVIPTVRFDGCINAYHYKAVAHVLPYPNFDREQRWFIPNRHIMSAVELKFPGQAMMFVPVTTFNIGHGQYPKKVTPKEMAIHWREFIDKIQEKAPLVYRNRSIWEDFKKKLGRHMNTSPSHCMNVTRHLPIVPYAHFERETS